MRYRPLLERDGELIVTSIPKEQRHLLDAAPDNDFTFAPEKRQLLFCSREAATYTTARTQPLSVSDEDARQLAYGRSWFWGNTPESRDDNTLTSLSMPLRSQLTEHELPQRLYALRLMLEEGDISLDAGEREWQQMLDAQEYDDPYKEGIFVYPSPPRPYTTRYVSRKQVITFK